jgi:chorismate dehydratase
VKVLRLGAVPYLNVQPLLWAFEKRLIPDLPFKVQIKSAPPRVLAQQLAAGEFDVAIVPVFEYLRNPGYTIVRAAPIATHGRVGSVILFSEVELEQIETIVLDPSSLTSVNLLRVILAERGFTPELKEPAATGKAHAPKGATARLLIGDPAIAELGKYRFEYDLGQLWHELTGLPFVFAAWLATQSAAALPLTKIFREAARIGMQALPEIAAERAAKFGTTPEFAMHYFKHNLTYNMTPRHVKGIQKFAELSAKHGLIPHEPILRFHKK